MKVLVAFKEILAFTPFSRLAADGSGLERRNPRLEINNLDQVALEQALCWREQDLASQVTAVTVGPHPDILCSALAMGADNGVHVKVPRVDSDLAARALAHIFIERGFDLFLMGQQASDHEAGQTVGLVAAYSQVPGLTYARELEWQQGRLQVTRDLEGWSERVLAALPCVVGVDPCLNDPRYAPRPAFTRASQEIETVDWQGEPKSRILNLSHQIGRPPARMLGSVSELLAELSQEGLS